MKTFFVACTFLLLLSGCLTIGKEEVTFEYRLHDGSGTITDVLSDISCTDDDEQPCSLEKLEQAVVGYRDTISDGQGINALLGNFSSPVLTEVDPKSNAPRLTTHTEFTSLTQLLDLGKVNFRWMEIPKLERVGFEIQFEFYEGRYLPARAGTGVFSFVSLDEEAEILEASPPAEIDLKSHRATWRFDLRQLGRLLPLRVLLKGPTVARK